MCQPNYRLGVLITSGWGAEEENKSELNEEIRGTNSRKTETNQYNKFRDT